MVSSYLWEAGDEDFSSLRRREVHPTARASSLNGQDLQLSQREITLPQFWRKLFKMHICWDKIYILPLLQATQHTGS